MRHWLKSADRRFGMVVILFAFWAVFWGLNGFDKFLNGTSAPNTAVTSGVILDQDGSVAYRIHPTQPIGWYGVTRDPKFIAYFKTLHLPKEAALTALYAIGVVQLLLCALFLALLLQARGICAEELLPRVAFKASVMVFYVFIVGDILFGDRMEVWEHGTYLILTFVTWEAWYRSSREFSAGTELDIAVHRGESRKSPVAA